jgi:hypothetical protein
MVFGYTYIYPEKGPSYFKTSQCREKEGGTTPTRKERVPLDFTGIRQHTESRIRSLELEISFSGTTSSPFLRASADRLWWKTPGRTFFVRMILGPNFYDPNFYDLRPSVD